jgi:hypothetical protein
MFAQPMKSRPVLWLLAAAALAASLALVLRPAWGPDPGEPEAEVPVADVPSDFGPRDLLRCLAARGLRLHVTPDSTVGDLGAGFYLSEQPRDRDSLLVLFCSRQSVERWSGVVKVVSELHMEIHPDDWGACGLRAGRLVLFGDPRLLVRIREALRECGG